MKINKYRSGFTLIEAAIALAVGSAFMAYTYTTIANGITHKKEASNLSKALFLTRLKMTQIDSGNKITADHSEGNIPGYKDYTYKIDIHEEEINLLELSGLDKTKESKPVNEDKLTPEERMNRYMEKRGKQHDSATGGIIKTFKIKIDISWPGIKERETFSTETFKSNEM